MTDTYLDFDNSQDETRFDDALSSGPYVGEKFLVVCGGIRECQGVNHGDDFDFSERNYDEDEEDNTYGEFKYIWSFEESDALGFDEYKRLVLYIFKIIENPDHFENPDLSLARCKIQLEQLDKKVKKHDDFYSSLEA